MTRCVLNTNQKTMTKRQRQKPCLTHQKLHRMSFRQVPSLKQFYRTFLPSQPMETEPGSEEKPQLMEQQINWQQNNWRRPASVNIRNEREGSSCREADSGSPIFMKRKQERSASLPSTAAESLQLPSDLICNKKMRATLLKANIDPTSQEGRCVIKISPNIQHI